MADAASAAASSLEAVAASAALDARVNSAAALNALLAAASLHTLLAAAAARAALGAPCLTLWEVAAANAVLAIPARRQKNVKGDKTRSTAAEGGDPIGRPKEAPPVL